MSQEAFTKIPNHILESVGDMTPAEFKIVMLLCRMTHGFHSQQCSISISKICTTTGMSRPTVLKAIDNKGGGVVRFFSRDGFVWSVKNLDSNPKETLHNKEETIKENIKETTPPPPIGPDMNGTLVPKSYGSHYQDFEDSQITLTRNGGEILGYLLDICHHISRTKFPDANSLAHYLDGEGIDSSTVKNALSSPAGYWRAKDWRGQKGEKPYLSQAETAIMEHVKMQAKRGIVKNGQVATGQPEGLFWG